MVFKNTWLAAATATLVLAAGSAQAGTVNLTASEDGIFGAENWSMSGLGRIMEDGAIPSYNGRAGAFHFDDGMSTFIAFCIEPGVWLDLGSSFETGTNPLAGSVMANVDKLFSAAYDQVTDALSAAAFQVALWEVVAENSGAFDLTDGNHYLATGGDVTALGNIFLGDMANAETGRYAYTTYVNDGQDQISVSEVPLPASALLLLAGLGGMTAFGRRKKA
ncbi:MAG: VPLPA-CTERM sorting domain-containing protein [Paracoccaceae bacterium]